MRLFVRGVGMARGLRNALLAVVALAAGVMLGMSLITIPATVAPRPVRTLPPPTNVDRDVADDASAASGTVEVGTTHRSKRTSAPRRETVLLRTRAPAAATPTATQQLVDDGERSLLPTTQRGEGERFETDVVRCVNNGMQEKCFFRNMMVRENTFITCGARVLKQRFPNPIYVPDGQKEPLIRYHKYRGHNIQHVDECVCDEVVRRPAVFVFRMSGHSTYHLWENNLGPFFATLQDFPEVKDSVNDPKQLVVVFTDQKPRSGPKAPHLLDQLLRTFSNVPLMNASRIGERTGKAVCFRQAVVGQSANHFPHTELLHRMMRNVVGFAPPPPLPEEPSCIFVSRNHKSVIRGRKIANEQAMFAALNATVFEKTGRPLRYVQFETMAYAEQVRLAMHTNIMFSPHGGGVANCIWMRKGSVMVEFVAPVGKTLLNMYHSMCGKSGVKHISFLADPDPADAEMSAAQLNNNARLFSNMVVPPERAVEHAERAIETYRENVRKQVART